MQELFEEIIARLEDKRNKRYRKDGSLICEQTSVRIDDVIDIINEAAKEYSNGWIDVDVELPKDDNHIMVSFANCSSPDIARYEEDEDGGAFYPGDDDKSYVSHGLIVNAWRPLPAPYRPEGE